MRDEKLKFLGIDLNAPIFEAISDYGIASALAILSIEYFLADLIWIGWTEFFLFVVVANLLVLVSRKHYGRTFPREKLVFAGSIPLFLLYIVFAGFRISWRYFLPRQLGLIAKLKEYLRNKI